jgi:xanthine/CO dehydrogenase XdhC/CoxF family maturation factor
MRELSDIVKAYQEAGKSGRACALATVVNVTGSTYRRPGAKMLFSSQGRLAGLINAACLESDLSERARKVIANGKPELISYDTTSPDDIVFGLGLGCNGTVEILMEPSQRPALADKAAVFDRSLSGGEPIAVATVIAASGRVGVQAGDFVAFDLHGRVAGTITHPRLASAIQDQCRLKNDVTYAESTIPYGEGSVRVFIEVLFPPLPLVLFGAGPDSLPLVDAAKLLGWNVTVVDHRPAYATKDNIPSADAILLSEPEQLADHLKLSERHVVVIMTHSFDKDRTLLRILLQSPCKYVGLLGPKTKLQTLFENLEREGFKPSEEQLNRLHAPVGLDIGAETPEEIALSIVSEIKAVLENRGGGFLRDRHGPIH